MKIVGLLPVKNEEHIIQQCLECLSLFTDSIVCLDDCSTDNTVQIIKDTQEKYNVETIIEKQQWERNEPADRNSLLTAGRKIGGTHFIVLDADEVFSSNLLIDNYLKTIIEHMEKGHSIFLQWIALWRSVHKYREDASIWSNNYGPFIFCDDGKSTYISEFIHTPRVPTIVEDQSKYIKLKGSKYGVLHFQYVNWDNLLLKQEWYMCLEKIRSPQKAVKEINSLYSVASNEQDIITSNSYEEWLKYYPNFDVSLYSKTTMWRQQQILQWFDKYGSAFFNGLNIPYIKKNVLKNGA